MEDTTQLETMLSQHFADQLAEPESLTEMEQMVRASLLEVGRRAFEHWLAAQASEEAGKRGPCEGGACFLKALALVSVGDHSRDGAAKAYGAEQTKREAEWETEAADMDKLL